MCAFTSIRHDCVGCFVSTWKGDCLGSSSCGQPRGALPLHQVTQRQVIKFADPSRGLGHIYSAHVIILQANGGQEEACFDPLGDSVNDVHTSMQHV